MEHSARPDGDQVSIERSPLTLPVNRYPTGWFQVRWSDELSPGDVRAIRYFGKDIVLWRDADGDVHANDAYCLHLGGNLGIGGTVEGTDLVCPWHNWRWNGEGRNTKIPYSVQSCKPHLRLETYPVRDHQGLVLIWHDVAGRDPLWEPPILPELDSADYHAITPDVRVVHRIRAHPQMAMENAADPFHVRVVHGGGETPVFLSFEFDGHYFHSDVELTYGAGRESTWLTPNGPVVATTRFMAWGLGLGAVRWPDSLTASLQISSFVPVDETYMDYWFAMTTKKRFPEEAEPTGRERKLIEHQLQVITQDFFTWENMNVLQEPNFVPEEAKYIGRHRRWARQFYPELNGDGAGAAAVSVTSVGGAGAR